MKRNEIIAANVDMLLPDLHDQNPSGLIFAANEARFTSANYSVGLTNYIQNWPEQENLEAMLEAIAPVVDSPRRFEFKKATNAEQFLAETDDVRAIGSAFKFVEYTGASASDKTLNKGLGIRIDHDDTVGDDWQERAVTRLRNRLLRNEIRRAIVLIEAAANANTSVWNKDTNPDKDLRDILRGAKNKTGIRPSRVFFGDDAWDLRADAYELQNTPAGGRKADMTPAQLAAYLRVEQVNILGAIYQSTASAKATVITALTVLAYYAQSNLSKDDPSNVKRFVSPARGGRWGVYVTPHEKFTDIILEHYSNTVITASTGIEKITVKAAA